MAIDETCAADGLWERLDDLELHARARIALQMQSFDDAFRLTYEAGVIVPVLRANGNAVVDVRVAALFFKRALNDFRAVYNLLQSGYTSQAASVAAALFENSLATICLTSSQSNVDDLLKASSGNLPWTAIQMAKMAARREGATEGSKEFENSWRSLYAHYVWLCQCKHPTMQTVIHDVSATQLASGYVVMALPNVKTEDSPYKAMVAVNALMRLQESIQAFAAALGYEAILPDDFRFAERFENAKAATSRAFSPFFETPNPVSIAGTWFVEKYPPLR